MMSLPTGRRCVLLCYCVVCRRVKRDPPDYRTRHSCMTRQDTPHKTEIYSHSIAAPTAAAIIASCCAICLQLHTHAILRSLSYTNSILRYLSLTSVQHWSHRSAFLSVYSSSRPHTPLHARTEVGVAAPFVSHSYVCVLYGEEGRTRSSSRQTKQRLSTMAPLSMP